MSERPHKGAALFDLGWQVAGARVSLETVKACRVQIPATLTTSPGKHRTVCTDPV